MFSILLEYLVLHTRLYTNNYTQDPEQNQVKDSMSIRFIRVVHRNRIRTRVEDKSRNSTNLMNHQGYRITIHIPNDIHGLLMGSIIHPLSECKDPLDIILSLIPKDTKKEYFKIGHFHLSHRMMTRSIQDRIHVLQKDSIHN